MVVAKEKYRDEEFSIPYNELKNAGFSVDVASTEAGLCRGMLGGTCEANLSISDVNVDDYSAVIFVGGAGTPSVRSDPNSLRIAKQSFDKGLIVGAICWAPTILAKSGILQGKESTVWKGFDPEYNTTTDKVLEEYGAKYLEQPVVVDGKIITAWGPSAARQFSKKLLELLSE